MTSTDDSPPRSSPARSVASARVADGLANGSTGVSPRSQARQAGALTTEVAERVADTMFALSTPSRVQILGCLIAGSHTVSDLMDALGMEQSAVSHQLRVLREHRLVTVERDGRSRVYTLYDDDVVALVEGALRHVEQRDRSGKRLTRRLKRSSG